MDISFTQPSSIVKISFTAGGLFALLPSVYRNALYVFHVSKYCSTAMSVNLTSTLLVHSGGQAMLRHA